MAEGRHRVPEFWFENLSPFLSIQLPFVFNNKVLLLGNSLVVLWAGLFYLGMDSILNGDLGFPKPSQKKKKHSQKKSATKFYLSCVHFPIFKNVEPVTTRYQLEGYIKCPDPGDTFAFKEQTLLLFLARDYGETVETVSDFIFLGSKITADADYSHEIKRRFTPWKESYDQPR